MLALTAKQRAFVLALTMSPDGNLTSAAAAAGYSGDRDALGVVGSRLKNHPGVQAAIHEEAERQLHGAKLVATKALVSIASNGKREGDQLKAAGMILDRVGMAAKTEHRVVVEQRRTEDQLIQEVTEMCRRMGLDPRKALGDAGVAIDAEFTEVTAIGTLEGLEDIL